MAIPDNIFTNDTFPYTSYTDVNLDWICDALKTQQAEIDQLASETVDYNDLNDKPSINSVTLQGDMTLSDLGIADKSVETTVSTLAATVDAMSRELYPQAVEGVKLDVTSITAVKGVISSVAANTGTNELSAIASSNTRCVMGPFALSKSVIMIPDSSVKYKLYKRFSSDTVAEFRDMWGSWATTQHIEGSNPKAFELCNYYIQAAYSDDSAISDPYDVLSHLSIIYTDSNPLGLIETRGTVSYSTVPLGVGNSGSVLRLESYKQYSEHKIAYYCKNTNARIAVWSSDDVYGDYLTGQPLEYGCKIAAGGKESIVLMQNYTGGVNTTIQMKDYSTFEAFYAVWGLNMDILDVDTRTIQGAQIYDYIAGLSAYNNGISRLSEMFTTGVMLNDGGQILYAHVPCVKVDGNTAYVVMQCDRTNNYEASGTVEIDVVKVNLNNLTQQYTVIAKSGGSYGGVTFNGRCTNPQCYLVGTTLHVLFTGGVSSQQTLIHCEYNTLNDSFTNTPATFTDNGTTSTLNATNFNRYIGAVYGVPNVSSEIIISAFCPYSGTYMSAFTSFDGECIRRTPIVYTNDFTDWKLYTVLDIEYGSHCETAMYIKDDTLYLAARHLTPDSTVKLMKFDLINEKITDTLQIPAVASRPAFYEQNGSVVLLNSVRGRYGLQMIQVSSNVLSNGAIWSDLYDNRFLAYPSIDLWNNQLVWAIQTRRNGSNTDTVTKIWLGISSKI